MHLKKYCYAWIFSLLVLSTTHAGELVGTWTGEEDTGAPYTFLFNALQWSMTHDAGFEWYEGTYTFNDNADPARLDLNVSDGFDNQFIGQTALYIYKIKGDTLTLSGGDPGSGYRPSVFSEGGLTRTFVLVNENIAPDDSNGDANDSDDEDKVELYVGCFVGMLLLE